MVRDDAEVEKAEKAVSGLKNVVVRGFVYKDVSSISVFYTDEIELEPVMMHEKLLQLLPEYMVPTNYIRLNEFPVLPSGKIDKQKIMPPEGSWEQFNNNPVSVLPLIGRGENFEIYDMGCGKAVKRFRSPVRYDRIWGEQVSMHKAYESGASAQNAYAIVRFESDYGILMDEGRTKKDKSVRTFDGGPLTDEDGKDIEDYVKTITNPYGIPVSFVFLGATERGLSSLVM